MTESLDQCGGVKQTATGGMSQWLSLAAGALLVSAGVKRGWSLPTLLGAAGGALLLRGISRSGPSPLDPRPMFARGVKVRSAIVVEKPPRECYGFWRNLENLPKFMNHLESVEVLSDRRSRWVMRSVADGKVSWNAEIVRDTPDRIIGWRSLPGSMVDTAGSIRFDRVGPKRTKVVVTLKYNPPAGAVGAAVMGLFGASPARRIADELQRLKELLEAGSAQQQIA